MKPARRKGWRPFQLDYADDPFWVLVGCVLVNVGSWKAAETKFHALRASMPNPRYFFGKRESIELIVRPLGLSERRADALMALAVAWHDAKDPENWTREDLLKVPGFGTYAADSWDIFVRKAPCRPRDRVLRRWTGMG